MKTPAHEKAIWILWGMFAVVGFVCGILYSQTHDIANAAVLKVDVLREDMNKSMYSIGSKLGNNEAAHISIQQQLTLIQEQLNRVEDKLYKKR
jgi:hypothetical protein